MALPTEALALTAELMENYAEHDEQARLELARHLSGGLAVSNANVSRVDVLRAEHESYERNFNIINSLVTLLPTADTTGKFHVDDEYSYRAVQARTVKTQSFNDKLPTAVWLVGKYYIVGKRPIKLEEKTELPFTELLLWPANEGHLAYAPSNGSRVEEMHPFITAVPTSHYQAFVENGNTVAVTPMNDEEVRTNFDPNTGKMQVEDFWGQVTILDWWRKQPIISKHLAKSPVWSVDMGSPKRRWKYQPRILDNGITTEDIASFEVLDNLVELVNDFGKGKEAAGVLLGAIASEKATSDEDA